MPRMQTGEPSSEHLRRMEKKREFEERMERFKLEAEKRKELERQALANEGAMEQQKLVSKTALEERRLANQGAFSSEILRNKGEMERKRFTTPLDQSQIDYNKVLHDYTLKKQQEADADLAKREAVVQEALSAEDKSLGKVFNPDEDVTKPKRLATDAILPRFEGVPILGKQILPLYGRKKKKVSSLFDPSLGL